MTTWYLWGENTHGVKGLFEVCEMTEADLKEEAAEMTKQQIASVGPDQVIEGTISQVVEWLQRNGCTDLETDHQELRLRTPEWQC